MKTDLKPNIKNFTLHQLSTWLKSHGIKPYRAKQIFQWVYVRQVESFDAMTDLAKNRREFLSTHFAIDGLDETRVETSTDGSKKYLFRLHDGEYMETVLIPEKKHYTLCISCQVGCAQGCKFCLTAQGGFVRNLKLGEITGQVLHVKKALSAKKPLANIVFMGMGEPLANYENVINAANIITDAKYGMQFSNRKVTISTAGIISKLSGLGQDTKVNLAVSLNAADNDTRSKLMPVNNRYPLEKLIHECKKYSLATRRKITFEYILLKNINDSMEDAKGLAKLLGSIKAKVNLIPFNEYSTSNFARPDESVVDMFCDILSKNGLTAMVRRSKGEDISAACGQLRVNTQGEAP